MPSAGKVIDSGVVSSSAGGYLVDISKAWVPNTYIGSYVYFPRTGMLALISISNVNDLAFSNTYIATIGEAYTIRESASAPAAIPTSSNLPVYDAAGTIINIPVTLA